MKSCWLVLAAIALHTTLAAGATPPESFAQPFIAALSRKDTQ